MNQQKRIYLSKSSNLKKKGFFLRILKEIDKPTFEIDENRPPRFLLAKDGGEAGQKKIDILEVWIKPLKANYPSVIGSEEPVIMKSSDLSKQVKIKLIDSKTNELYDQVRFTYKDAPHESCMDNWAKK